ncbi:MAG: TIM-barrel domain-containing protein [Phocaeicola sp.]
MRLRNTSMGLLALLSLASCGEKEYEKLANGIVVHVQQKGENDVRKVRLQVMGEKLIHVTATPEKTFSDRTDLITVPVQAVPDFSVETTDSTVVLLTSQLRTWVYKCTGEVKFFDADGKLLLAENQGGGKTFTPITVEGKSAYTVQQVFESPADEAFYGLGQHQADEFNYKGKNEELFQYNTKVSVPFIVSTRNYGLLWDSYSLSRFGDPRDYMQLGDVFTLYTPQGEKGSLVGSYTPAKGEKVVRNESRIYFEDQKTIKDLPTGFPLMGSNVTYEGVIEPNETGEYRFILYYAGYVKVFVGGEEVVPERWRTAWNPNSYKFALNLEAGKKLPLKIEWIPDGGESYCGLRALTPVNEEIQTKQSWWSEMNPEISYYFVQGNTMDEIISGYRSLTGKAQIMPKWAMGYWQSRERYKTQEEILDALKGFRQRQIPIDNIVVDWNYWPEDAWGSHEFDLERFPDPKGMVDDIHKMNAKIMISVWPKFYHTTEHYKEFDEKGWMYQQAVKDSIRDWVGPGYIGSFYDAYDPEARKLFWKQMAEHLYPLGFDAWWMDASEPNVRDCTDMDYRKALCGPTALGPSTEFFNAYALVNAEAIYDGQRELDNDKRVFLLTRSGFTGLQRYSTATWSGDIATRWEDMKAQISAGLNFAVSGIPYWTMDIGGFCVENRFVGGQQVWDATGKENADYKEWRELNARWFQFGAFTPLYRAHGQYPFREFWNIAPENHPAYKTMVYYTKLRYNLMPYIYSLAGMTHFNDYTIMRPLVMDFDADKATREVGDQFMFGPSLLVCPVYEYGARSREVYLPNTSTWYDFYTGKVMPTGGQKVDAPYERIPMYVCGGAILPYGPDMQYSDEKPASEITLYVYEGANGSFTIYEDENVNYNYEKGNYATIPMSYDDAAKTITFGERKGAFAGMLKERTFNVVFVGKNKAQAFDLKAKGEVVSYKGTAQTLKLQ